MITFGYSLPDNPKELEAASERLLGSGEFSWVELGTWQINNPNLLESLEHSRNRYPVHLSVHCDFVDINLSSSVEEIRQAALQVLRRNIRFSASQAAERVVIHGGDIGWYDFLPLHHPDYEVAQGVINSFRRKHLLNLENSLVELSDETSRLGLELLVENMYFPWELLNSPSEVYWLLKERLQGMIGMTLDFGHSMVSGHDPIEYVHALGGLIRHTHIHDNDGQYDLHLPVGKGKLDYRKIFPALVRANPNVTLLFELTSRPIDDILDGRQRALEALSLEI